MNNNNQTIRKQHYTSTVVITIVGVLIFVGLCIYLYNVYKDFKDKLINKNEKTYASCPDYWDSIGNNKCQNSNMLGSCSNRPGSNIMDFSGEIFTNKNTGDYAKCKWANSCNLSWSGIDRIC
jgi:hypothetical protein